ncbi:hypothetical protein EES41_06865 [Streptomyces sp. ADI95-16]|nr:hypothetical protein EES41_06865 [Streptomyces sp. ADI95-16]
MSVPFGRLAGRTETNSCATAASTARITTTRTPGPLPHRTYAVLVGGPLDGLLLDIHGWRPEEIEDGAALMTELSRWPGGRALYDPRPGAPRTPGPGVVCRFYYSGDTPRPPALRCSVSWAVVFSIHCRVHSTPARHPGSVPS